MWLIPNMVFDCHFFILLRKWIIFVVVYFDFVIVIDFDYSYWGVLLFWILQKIYSYDLRSYFYLTSFAYLFVLMSLLV